MEAWVIALLMKGAAIVLLAFGYYVVVYRGSHMIGRFIPNGRIKEWLFRERGGGGSRPG